MAARDTMHDDARDTLRLGGATNFRSLGGFPVGDGRRLRPHALMRADRLSRLTDEDWSTLASTGLATICDLRSDAERAEHPTVVPAGLAPRMLNCDIRNDLRADPALAQMLVADPTARGVESVMIEIYRRFPGYMGGTLTTIVDRLLDDGAPLLVHCSAGKDRTGFVVAMLLHALGVPEPRVREDYLASRHWPGRMGHFDSLAARLGRIVPPEELAAAVDAALDVRDVYLDAALEGVEAGYGSVMDYLEVAAGLRGDRLERLRERLLG